MSLNDLSVASVSRRPRGTILVDGTDLRAALIEMEWQSNTFFEADTFNATLAVSRLPKSFGPAYFGDTAPLPVEIFAGFPVDPNNFTAANLASMFYGTVDTVEWTANETAIKISGRDLTAKFTDTKSDEKYANQTASQIVSKIASTQGLTPVVTATTTLVGHYYEIDHVGMQDNRTLWNLICYLAQQEGFVAYVTGKELHFEPAPDLSGDPYEFFYRVPAAGELPAANATSFTFSRSLTLAKDIVVKVRSCKPGQKRAFTMTARARHVKSSGETQTYVFNVAGLTTTQAQKRAEAIAADLTKHERKVAISGPADNILKRTDAVKISGTGTSWDQTYFVESISRRYSFDEGYGWTVNLKNHSPESEANL